MKAKEELLRFVFDNEFITKPRLKNEFELLLNRVIEEAQQQLKNCNLQNVSSLLLADERSKGYKEGWSDCLDAHGLDE